MEHIYDTVIIGGGPAGYTAGLYASRAGLDTLLIEKMSAGGQMTTTGSIDNYPGFPDGVDGFDLGFKMQAGAEKYGTKTEYAEVVSVVLDKETKEIRTRDKSFFAKSVIIATGAYPKTLGLDGERDLTGRGIHYCAHCDGRFYKGKTVVVVGGGNSAASDALYLSHLAEKVILIHRRDTLRATKIYHDPLLSAENVEFLWNSAIGNILSDKRVTGITVSNTVTGESMDVQCDGVFVSIGRQPETEIFKEQLELDIAGYIVADESCRTSLPGVFVAGDVRTKTLRQVITAASDGAVAANAAEEYISLNK